MNERITLPTAEGLARQVAIAKAKLPKIEAVHCRHYLSLMDKRMARIGAKKLGAGAFSMVFAHPKDPKKVIKWGPLADGWIAFAAWVDAHRDRPNPHLPAIYSVKRYEKHGIYCAIMERLDTTVWKLNQRSPRNKWSQWDRVGHKWFRQGLIGEGPCSWDGTTPEKWEALLTRLGNRETLVPLLTELKGFAERHGLSKDLHSDNVMLRKKGRTYEMVITDPFSFGDPAPAVAALKTAA